MAEDPQPASFLPNEKESESTPPPEPPPTQTIPSGEPPKKKSLVSTALGNLILLIILLCLVSIPVLVYFTDTPSRLKRNLREVGAALNGSETPVAVAGGSGELSDALKEIAKLERENVELRRAAEEAATAAANGQQTTPAAPPEPIVTTLPRQEYDTAKLFNGVNVKTTLDLQEGTTASKEREEDAAYEFEVKLKINVPKANQSLDELAALNPQLPKILPGLEKMLGTAKVSPFYAKLYNEKHKRIRSVVTRLHSLETRHNYFDCETMLELTHPDTGQKALLMQGEMDVVADGSDGDRMPEVDDYISLSTHYQATTSYGWAKVGRTPNPLLERFEKELEEVLKEYAIPGLTPARNQYLVSRRDTLRRIIPDLKGRSFLIAEADPFIVLPLSLLGESGAHSPGTGDYAVVIHGDKAYPAICGDAGPRWKMGEASLFVAKTINEKASPYSRPESDLEVTYLVFPRSRDERKGPPNLATWTAKCEQLVNGLGGLGEGFALYEWRDIIAERKAVRESKKLIGASNKMLADADGYSKTAKDAAAAAKTNFEALLKEAEDAAAASAADAAAKKEKSDAAGAKAETAAAAAIAAAKGALEAKEAVAEITEAAATAKEANDKSPKTPRTESTDIGVAALAKAEAAYDRAVSGAQTAKTESEKAKAAAE